MQALVQWLDGKKTYIGIIAWGVVRIFEAQWPELAPVWNVGEILAQTLTGVGVGHKLEKVKKAT